MPMGEAVEPVMSAMGFALYASTGLRTSYPLPMRRDANVSIEPVTRSAHAKATWQSVLRVDKTMTNQTRIRAQAMSPAYVLDDVSRTRHW